MEANDSSNEEISDGDGGESVPVQERALVVNNVRRGPVIMCGDRAKRARGRAPTLGLRKPNGKVKLT